MIKLNRIELNQQNRLAANVILRRNIRLRKTYTGWRLQLWRNVGIHVHCSGFVCWSALYDESSELGFCSQTFGKRWIAHLVFYTLSNPNGKFKFNWLHFYAHITIGVIWTIDMANQTFQRKLDFSYSVALMYASHCISTRWTVPIHLQKIWIHFFAIFRKISFDAR